MACEEESRKIFGKNKGLMECCYTFPFLNAAFPKVLTWESIANCAYARSDADKFVRVGFQSDSHCMRSVGNVSIETNKELDK